MSTFAENRVYSTLTSSSKMCHDAYFVSAHDIHILESFLKIIQMFMPRVILNSTAEHSQWLESTIFPDLQHYACFTIVCTVLLTVEYLINVSDVVFPTLTVFYDRKTTIATNSTYVLTSP